MRNWKELGEIPDSEEEDGFDSQSTGSHDGLHLGGTKIEGQPGDIWDVPLSQTEAPATAAKPEVAAGQSGWTEMSTQKPQSRVLWDVPLSQGDDELSNGQHAQSDRLSPLPDAAEPVSSPLSTLSTISFDDLSHTPTLSILGENPAFGSSRGQQTPVSNLIDMTGASPASTPSRIVAPATPVVSSELGERESEYVARQVAVRYERSLRARKPIQQHPFLLEAAQYRTSMKSSGLKPLRIATIETESRRREGEIQERAYEPESQDSNGAEGSGSRETGSQLLEVFDDWEFPPSSPPSAPGIARMAAPSSQTSSPFETDGTSIQMDDLGGLDELPALEDLLSHPRPPSNKYTPKRRPTSPRTSSKKKQQRLALDSDDILPPVRADRGASPDPLQKGQDTFAPSSSFEPVPNFLEARSKALAKQPRSAQPQRSRTPVTPAAAPDAMVISNGSESAELVTRLEHETGDDSDSSESASEGGEQIMSAVGRKIRGVLPASWMRLDQQSGRDNIRKAVANHRVNRSPQREHRRGVAQKRKSTMTAAQGNNRLWSDESDTEAPAVRQTTTDDAFPNQTRLMANQMAVTMGSMDLCSSDDDGAGSGMEDNQIDHMPAPRKRQIKLSEAFKGTSKRHGTPQSSSTVEPSSRTAQPKITSTISGATQPPSALQVPKSKRHRTKPRSNGQVSSYRSSRTTKNTKRRQACALSILDVLEPDAPRFLKIAARTAKQRPDKGRASPSRKAIRLANREDHVDALSVLHKWRAGSISQRASVTSSVQKRKRSERPYPLSETSGNQTHPRTTEPLRKTKSVQATVQSASNRVQRSTLSRANSAQHAIDSAFRPAQLETSGDDPVDSRTFYSGKRALDKLFRKARTAPSTADVFTASGDMNAGDDRQIQPQRLPPTWEQPAALQPKASKKSRYRKQTRPAREDLDAPQFVHAHDPLPRQQEDSGSFDPAEARGTETRMTGLGPYGTQYTHHFEVFPLPSGIYFHESSLIGRGVLASLVDKPNSASDDTFRPRVSYTLGDQVLRWGPWSEQVSSELGILFDFMLEKLHEPGDNVDDSASAVTKAADFVLSYIKCHMSFEKASDVKAFFARFLEIVSGFSDKLIIRIHASEAFPSNKAVQRAFERILLAALCVLQICHSEPSFVNEQIQAEDMLKIVATSCISTLMQVGTNDLRQTYKTLTSARVREKGIKEDDSSIHTWTIVMKVLDEARLLRASFWDLVQANLAARESISSHDAEKLDLLWQDLFSFLPLVEFNNIGVLVPGSRHDAVHEGWALPQRLLRPVFQLYCDNPRQPPGFNNYCRALVGRCHYLVDHWSWKKSSSVIGVIFDFFGSQDLAHLRNEEVYKSPRFLENLATAPKLDIEAEDRCFHVFLKLVALSIRKLRDVDATKDIRNLVARTMPNHSRQYPKESNLHERSLAALRNHHDLLCTLFWACPPEMRPSATLIEGLVDPASSHKEICLISLRSWSQLARFLVSNGEASTSKVFGPFVSWRDSFFSKTLQQYSSIASEINQQFHSLGKEERQGVSDDMLKAMISANKVAVQDVLHSSVTASHDVMMQCPDLEAAVWSLSTKQLRQVFDHFSAAPPELDWSILVIALKTLSRFLAKIDEFKDGEESQERESQLLDSEQADDALQTLDECVAKRYFAMARCVLSSRGEKSSAVNIVDKATCKELIVKLSSKFAARLVSSGSMQLGQLFKYNKYGLFDAPPYKLDLDQRRYLTLCILSLLEANIDDFGDASFSLLDIWMLSIVKPREGLCWENRLAQGLQRIGAQFIPEAAAGLAVQPHYESNKDMFEFAITHMRKMTREAEPSRKKILVSEYAHTLKTVMEQMSTDLKNASQDATEHPAYVSFVRDIISLIRSHGADICAIDDFFYQISKDYSPPAEDPLLQVAGMISYELKLDDPGARQQLFFFMFNSFKLAMNKNQLGEHTDILLKGIKRVAIRQFVLGKLLPAAFGAAWIQSSAVTLVDLCTDAFELLLAGNILSTELTTDDLVPLLSTIAAIANGFHQLTAVPTAAEVHLINRAISLMNLIWSSLLVLRVRGAGKLLLEDVGSALGALKSSFQIINRHLELDGGFPFWETSHLAGSALRQVGVPALPDDPDVTSFKDNIVRDIERNWNVGERRIGIKTPAKSRGTQSSTPGGQGVEVPERDMTQLYGEMQSHLAVWLDNYAEMFEESEGGQEKSATLADEDFVF